MIRFDKLTVKAQEALQSAQETAQKLNHQEVDCEHMISALIEQPEGLVRPLLEKLGPNPDAILRALDEELNRRPQVRAGKFKEGDAVKVDVDEKDSNSLAFQRT